MADLKAFADNLTVTKTSKSVYHDAENIMGKRENAGLKCGLHMISSVH